MLQTQQTTLQLAAGEHAPRVVSLKTGRSAAWINGASETPIAFVDMDGRSVPLQWRLNRGASHSDPQHVVFVYESASPHLRLSWEWKAAAASGPIEHSIHIENLSTREIQIPLQDSFRFEWHVGPGVALEHLYVDKGAGKPSAIGTHHLAVPVGYRWKGTSSSYARDGETEIIPWFMVERASSSGDGWYVGVEFSGRTRLSLQREGNFIRGAAGLNPDPGPFRTRLLPSESFDAPTVFVGGFSGGRDGLGNVLRPWVRQVLTNPVTWQDPHYPLLTNNSWGSGMQVNEELSHRMIRDSAELGLEMFHLDAGWFRGVGDWYPDEKKFPHGLAALSEEAHKSGLKFGIWVDWAQAGVSTEAEALNVHNPKTRDWLVADAPADWKPDEFVGRTTDLGLPAARDYAQREVMRIVREYRLDMLEHDGYVVAKNCARSDHPHMAQAPPSMSSVNGSGINMPDTANSTDVNYHAVRAYYDIYSHLRREHPELLLEICNDGGRMVDFGSAAHGDYFSITDSYDPLSNRQAFYDTSQVLPAAMLEDYVQKWPTPTIENFRYMLRSGMMGWLTIMQDTNAWTPSQHDTAKQEFALYKNELRPLIRDANLYHISQRPDGVHWDGIEYFDPRRGDGVVYAFRGSGPDEDRHSFVLQGLRPDRRYSLRFQDHTSADRTATGAELLQHGLGVSLPEGNSSELIHLRELAD
ncbi:MAG TPA: alpha-galactosidase [Acidisarcina sp.]|nr:alpha-galactosidase [Acidisarcina sp.]